MKASLLVNGKARVQTRSCRPPHLLTGQIVLSGTFFLTSSFLQISSLFSCGAFVFFPQESKKREKSWKNKSEINLFWKMRVCEGSVELAGSKGEAILDFACVSEECVEMSGRNRK